MGVDAQAVARVLGITTEYKDMREGGVLFLPQRIAVFAQGASDAVYSTDKFQATSAGPVGARVGPGSPAHHIFRQLFPVNGDGVGGIPVTLYPLEDDPEGVAAEGDITPSGSQTKAASYRVVVNEVRGLPFVVPVGATVGDICRRAHGSIAGVLEMPVKPSYEYGAVTGIAHVGNTGNGTVTALSVVGDPAPGVYTLDCTAVETNGGTFRLRGPDGDVLGAALVMTTGVGEATVFSVAGIQFTVTDGTDDFVIGDSFDITVAATQVVVTAKWKGESGNAIRLWIEGEHHGVDFAITQPAGGLVNPSIAPALAKVGGVWETMGINALNFDDADALAAIHEFGEGRWGYLQRKPLVVFTGNTEATVEDATAVCAALRDNRTNSYLTAEGSRELPFVVAARQLARIAVLANNNPPHDYGSQRATGLVPGPDEVQWDYLARDRAVKLGCSTCEVKDGVVNVSDVVTFYRPTGEEPPGFRHVVDIVKLQNIIFNLGLCFANADWDGAPLIPDGQPTVNPKAKTPKMARTRVAGMLDSLALHAIISDPNSTKKALLAWIDAMNPKRLNLRLRLVKLSGNANVTDAELEFGFFFGGAPAS